MSNKSGAIHRSPEEWGSKARKEEDALRGINNRARREHLAEQLADLNEEAHAADAANCYDDGPEALDAWDWDTNLGPGVLINGDYPDIDDSYEDEYFEHFESDIYAGTGEE